MIKFTFTELCQAYCKARKKWGIYISWKGCASGDEWEVTQAAPYLHDTKDMQMVFDGAGFLCFGTEKEMLKVYEQTVGDDGPTKTNKYKGPVHVYALTIDPYGKLMNENT